MAEMRPCDMEITVRVGIDPETIWGMTESLASLALVSGRVLQGEQSYAQRLTGLIETLDIFSIEDRVGPAPSAEIIKAFALAPTEGYLDLFAAIVRDGYAYAGAAVHGWPILSLVVPTGVDMLFGSSGSSERSAPVERHSGGDA